MSEFINTIDVLGDDAVIDSIIQRTITEFKDNRVETVGAFSFRNCTSLTVLELPNARNVFSSSFSGCSALSRADLPKATKINAGAFQGCTALSNVNVPNVADMYEQVFVGCKSLNTLVMPSLRYLAWGVFAGSGITHLVLARQAICSLTNVSSFTNTPIASGTGYIYVPKALVDSYKTATN
jgi:hypothetical protein